MSEAKEIIMKTDLDKVKQLAKDLRKGCPRSPREKLGGYVITARCVDRQPFASEEYG